MQLAIAPPINRALRRVPTWPLWGLGFVPAIWLTWLLFTGGLGVDPVAVYERELGLIALQFLLAGLCVTPLLRFTGINLIRFRRALGVTGFAYAGLHLLVWVVLDKQFFWAEMAKDLLKRPFIMVGMAAFLLLVPLALTSTDGAIRRIGAAGWRRLHLLTYPAAILGASHYLLVVKSWPMEPILYLCAAVGLVLLRLGWLRRSGRAGSRSEVRT
jgi:methionine sulfoxide reductase heme-binding subunit